MLLFVLTIAILNLALGFALAVLLDRRCARQPMRQADTLASSATRPNDVVPDGAQPTVDESAGKAASSALENLPETWRAALDDSGFHPASLDEAGIWFLRLQTEKYLSSLASMEDRTRDYGTVLETTAMHELLTEIECLSQDWIAKHVDVNRHLDVALNPRNCQESIVQELRDTLAEQVAQTKSTCSRIKTLDADDDALDSGQQMILEISGLARHAHRLRDRLDKILADTLRTTDRLTNLDPLLAKDELTGLTSRIELEAIYHRWWSEDPARHRMASAAIVDVDQFNKLNQRWGATLGDKILGVLGRQLPQLVAPQRDPDHVARLSGTTIAFFFPDAGTRNATTVIELVRQTVEAMTFEVGESHFQMTLSCALTEVDQQDTTASIFERLRSAVDKVQAEGGNQTVHCDRNGVTPVEPSECQVEHHVLTVAEDRNLELAPAT